MASRPDFLAPSATTEISAEHFVSEEDRELFNGLTYLLQRTESCYAIRREKGGALMLHEDGRCRRRTYIDVQNLHTNALERACEDIAVTITCHAKRDADGIVTVHDHAEVVVVEKPGRADDSNHDRVPQSQMLRFTAESNPGCDLQPSGKTIDTVNFVLVKYRKALEANRTELSSIEHIGIYSELVRRVHSHPAGSGARKDAINQLRIYVFLVSHEKMERRFRLGKGNRNFYKVLTREPTPSDAAAWRAEPTGSLANRRPSHKECRWLEEPFEAFNMPEQASEVSIQPIYGVRGRMRLHMILISHLRAVDSSLSKLKEAADFSKNKMPPDGKEFETFAENIARLVESARNSVLGLTLLINRFEEVLKEHLQWLGNTFAVRSADEIASSDLSSTIDDDDATDIDSLLRKVDLNFDFSKSNFDGETTDEMEIQGETWADAATKWLHLICRHEESLLKIISYEECQPDYRQLRKSKRIRNSSVSVVTIWQDQRLIHGERLSIRECIGRLEELDPHLDIDILKCELGSGKDFISTTRENTPHPAMIALLLKACQYSPNIATALKQDLFDDNDNFTPKNDSTKPPQNLTPFLTDANKCCPSCQTLCKVLLEQGIFNVNKNDLPASTLDTSWSAVSLPHFAPKAIAEDMLRHIKKKAVKRLLKIQWAKLDSGPWNASSFDHHTSPPPTKGLMPDWDFSIFFD